MKQQLTSNVLKFKSLTYSLVYRSLFSVVWLFNIQLTDLVGRGISLKGVNLKFAKK